MPLRPVASGPPRPSCHSFNDYSRTPGCLIVSAVGTPSKVSNIERNENMVLEDGQQGYPPRPVFNAHGVTYLRILTNIGIVDYLLDIVLF